MFLVLLWGVGLETKGVRQETKQRKGVSVKKLWALLLEKGCSNRAAMKACGHLWWVEPPVGCLHFCFNYFCSLKQRQCSCWGQEVSWPKSDKAEILKMILAVLTFSVGEATWAPFSAVYPSLERQLQLGFIILLLFFGSYPSTRVLLLSCECFTCAWRPPLLLLSVVLVF